MFYVMVYISSLVLISNMYHGPDLSFGPKIEQLEEEKKLFEM